MDEEFIGRRELILGGVGLGVALLLLVVLSLLQTSRKRREGAARLAALEADSGDLADAPPGRTPFFVACYNAGKPRFFRAYIGERELLFLNAGQYFALIDVESVRGTDQRHWLLRSVKLISIALGAGAVAAGIGIAAILRGVARGAAQNPGGAFDILQMVFGIVAFLAVMVVVGVPLMLWQVTRRCRQLDQMSLARLRQEAELNPLSFRATPDTAAEFQVALLDQRDNFISSSEVGSTLKFRDSVAGRWKVETKATADTRAALAALRSIWGSDRVAVDADLRKRLGEKADDPVPDADGPRPLTQRIAAAVKAFDAPQPATLPKYGFPRDMLLGFAAGALIAVGTAAAMSAGQGRFSYTGLLRLAFALGGAGTYLGHVAGCLRHKDLGLNPFGPINPGVLAVGGCICLLGSAAVLAAAMGIMTLLYGPPPH